MAADSIQFIVQDTSNAFVAHGVLRKWLKEVLNRETSKLVELSFVLMSDEALLRYNKQYLNHDYYTDVITFDNSEGDSGISGDVLMSLDRITENAQKMGLDAQEELKRVMVHGVLHLCGYSDKTSDEQAQMRALEDKYLSLYGR